MTCDLRLRPIPVFTGSGDDDGRLVLADGRLVAVLVRLRDQAHDDLVGAWFLEAGFGPCAEAAAPIFATLDAARDWVHDQIEALDAGRSSRA